MFEFLELWGRLALKTMDAVPDEVWLRHFPEDRPSRTQERYVVHHRTTRRAILVDENGRVVIVERIDETANGSHCDGL